MSRYLSVTIASSRLTGLAPSSSSPRTWLRCKVGPSYPEYDSADGLLQQDARATSNTEDTLKCPRGLLWSTQPKPLGFASAWEHHMVL
ncbi:hypothetical protein FRC11_001163, partial [Ceratobasidium sp. 423]